MGSLLIGGNKKANANQNINCKLIEEMRFYGFMGVGFLFKIFKPTH